MATGRPARSAQSGASAIEMAVVLPFLIIVTSLLLHYGLLFSYKNQINHATFMAARAGAVNNTNRAAMREALINNLVPAYGGGFNDAELAASRVKAATAIDLVEDVLGRNAIEIISPSKEAYDDWSDSSISVIDFDGRTIPNSGLEYKSTEVRSKSNLNIQDANILRIKVTVPYKILFPYVKYLLQGALIEAMANDPDISKTDYYALVARGYVPVVTYATLQMHSDPVEN